MSGRDRKRPRAATLGAAVSYARFVAKAPGYFRRPLLTLDDARRRVRRAFEQREETFLDLMDRAVWSRPQSPYLPLLRLARCERGDVAALVRDRGIEGALHDLRRAGVYVSFEEFKGRTPMIRDGYVTHVADADFDNPLLKGTLVRSSGGSTGRPTTIHSSLEDREEHSAGTLLSYEASGVRGVPTAAWFEPPNGMTHMLMDARFGQPYERWFAPRPRGSAWASLRNRMTWLPMVAIARSAGVKLPMPERTEYDAAVVVARWAATTVAEHGVCLVRSGPSQALRTATAAVDEGLDLGGVTFMGGGEPVSAGKLAGITRSGARWVPNYTISEVGKVGAGCARGIDGTDVHLLNHYVALITHPRVVPGADIAVDAFLFTTLRSGAPKFLLNVEMDDYGTIEQRSCGCLLEEAGWAYHLRDIFSFSKLTGEGVTFVGNDMARIVEEVLPRRFGGTALDFQFVEDEDDHGFTKLTLVVDPQVGNVDEADVVRTVLEELGDGNLAEAVRSIWSQAGTVRVRRAVPRRTGRGKAFPLVTRTAPRMPGSDA